MNLNDNPELLRVGMKVTTGYIFGEEEVVRKITYISKYKDCDSGYIARADGGEPCPCCKRTLGTPIGKDGCSLGIDASWFTPVDEGELV